MTLTTRQSLLELAQLDWNQSIISIQRDVIAHLEGISSAGMPSFSYMVDRSWSLRQMAVYWIYCAAQAFKFWELQPGGGLLKYHYRNMTGSTAMFHCIRDNWIDGCLSEVRVESAFEGAQNSASRIRIGVELSSQRDKLYELAHILVSKATTGLLNVVDAALLAESFPMSFSDPYLKQVPRVLRSLGVIEYSPCLAELVDGGVLIGADSEYERAIRGATIVAVDRIADRFRCPAVVVDNVLWRSQELANGTKFHLTETSNY